MRLCVFGAGGLLGRAVVDAFSAAGHSVTTVSVIWSDVTLFTTQTTEQLTSFLKGVSPGEPWAILWCAGAGFVGVDQAILDTETGCLQALLTVLKSLRQQFDVQQPGTFFFSSSAGGVYGRCDDVPITESSEPLPVSPYGHAKLKQENLLRDYCAAEQGLRLLIGRFSNLYGANQNLKKPQGLISHIARSIVAHHPINIFVPLDVLRDYLHVRDAAALTLQAIEHLETAPAGTQVMKVFATGQPASVAEILGTFRRLTRRKVATVIAVRPETGLQPRRLVFQSRVHPEWTRDRWVPLLQGINEVLTAEQSRGFGHRPD